ncbi:MAG: hypothetical protein ACLUSL_07500 [Ruminococcus sp.]
MQFFAETFARLTAYQELCNAMEQGIQPISLTGVAQVHKAHLLAALCSIHAPLLAVTAEEAEARRLCDDINTMLDQTAAWQFPSRELVLTPVEGVTVSYEHARIAALTAMRQGQCRVIIASIEALLQPTIAPEALEEHTLVLHCGEQIERDALIQKLIFGGYVRSESVSGAGQFSVRGDILDIFPVQCTAPIRLELWGDEIDTLTQFDPETQRRTQAVEELRIPPARETLFQPEELAEKLRTHARSLRGKYAEAAKKKLCDDAKKIDAGIVPVYLEKYAPLLREKAALLLDYGVQAVLFSEYNAVQEMQHSILEQYRTDCQLLLEEGTSAEDWRATIRILRRSWHG